MSDLTIAVTGLNATDNPGPGISVIRALRMHPEFDGRIVGLAYDSLEPGVYARELVDSVYLIPYPSQGTDALASRLEEIVRREKIDVIIPTLDAELASFIALEERLSELGIGTFLPTREQLDVRSKANLFRMGEKHDIAVPKAVVLHDVQDLYSIHQQIPYPFFVKGLYYGATRAESIDEAVQGFHRIAAQWGLPVIVQELVHGDELDVVALGDGHGGLVGALPMRKTTITDKGKGWAGIAIKDPELLALTERFISALKWRGPCEVEIVKTFEEGKYYVLEVNPRFPAWVYLTAGAGINLPYAAAELAAKRDVPPMRDFRVGTMFVRISLDQIARLEDFQQLTTHGQLTHRGSTP